MRTSKTVLLFAFAGSACATSEPIDPAATRGGGMLFDAGSFDTGTGMNGGGGDPGAGGFSAGGFPSAGGFVASGGVPTMGGAAPTAGGAATAGGSINAGGSPPVMGGSTNRGSSGAPPGGTPGSCQADEKVCGGICVRPAPSNGCAPTGCTACATPAPSNGIQACINGQCDFNCLSGFTKSGTSCTGPTGGGGAAGGGGGTVTCNGQTCSNSCLGGAARCCNTVLNQCGCMLGPLCV